MDQTITPGHSFPYGTSQCQLKSIRIRNGKREMEIGNKSEPEDGTHWPRWWVTEENYREILRSPWSHFKPIHEEDM